MYHWQLLQGSLLLGFEHASSPMPGSFAERRSEEGPGYGARPSCSAVAAGQRLIDRSWCLWCAQALGFRKSCLREQQLRHWRLGTGSLRLVKKQGFHLWILV